MPSKGKKDKKRGFIIPIGGAEEKIKNPIILTKFVELCGSAEGKIAIIPTASRLDDTGEAYVDLFKELGIGEAVSLEIKKRKDCKDDSYLAELESATGIFITGGNQLRLSTILGGTAIAQAIRRLNADGIHVAGTSAGAAIIPEHMIAGGKTGPTPKEGSARFAPGLGLTNAVVIDQHFRQRDRIGRLLAATSYNPFAIGLGIDEDTSIFLGPNDKFEVVGSGGVTVIDASDMEYSSMAQAGSGEPVSFFGIKMHILASKTAFNLKTREAKRVK